MGPVANTLSDGLTNLFQAIMNFNPIVFGLVLGILWQVLVMFGMHWALIPLAISDVATNGSLSILSAALLPCFTQTGVLGYRQSRFQCGRLPRRAHEQHDKTCR